MEDKKEKNLRNSIRIFEILAVFLVILKTQSIFTFLKETDLHINIILVMSLTILTFLKLISHKIRIKGQNKKIICIVGYIIYVLIYAILTKCTDRPFFINYIIILPIMFINISFTEDFIKEIKNVAKIYVSEIVIITIITNQVLIEWGEIKSLDTYCYLHFNTQNINILNIVLNRNSAIFTEAPMFALHLIIALAMAVFLLEPRKSNIIILVIGLCSTFTLTAFISIFVIYLLYLAFNYKKIFKSKKIVIINIIALVITIVGAIILFNARSNSSSLNIRLDDYNAAIKAFKDNVFLGKGCMLSLISCDEEMEKYISPVKGYGYVI